ncbi:translation initiation factor IF-2 N-terminal domain-containing protein [Nocardia callitridis]|uniref:Translation initiation factor IF-2 N-terminal domain-containing protein n=1 Tax=Nocardia callitridis TaxID=648753 RepID=A0ABP9L0G8_9NOCA
MADQEPPNTTAQDAEQLPERIRVHALAKLLGTTSKRILAKLTELGSEARSAQSNVDRSVAESVRDALVPDEAAAAEPVAPAPDPTSEPRQSAAGQEKAAETTEDTRSTGKGATASGNRGVMFSAPDPVIPGTEPSVEPAHRPSVQLFTHLAGTQPQAPAPVAFEAPAEVSAPLFLSPDAAAAEEARKQRRLARESRKAEQQQAAAEPAEPESSEHAEYADKSEDVESDGDRESDDSGDQHDDGQPRRRRRGRRGRGRGRGEQQSDDGDDDSVDQNDADTADRQSGSGGKNDDSATGADAKSTGDAKSGDTKSGDAKSGDAKSGDAKSGDAKSESSNSDASDGDAEDDENSDGSTRRRRRRRRRKVSGDSGGDNSGDDATQDDPPNTVVHEREPRNKSRNRTPSDEVQGISGSTRLEAKRQRRRDGREAGRRRPPILTESEFLARRESVDRVMVVREKSFPDHPTATQVAVLEDNILVEHFVTSTGSASMVGNVYLGRVQNVLPSMEAAFVDIGRGRNGVLYAGEVNWEAAGLGGRERKIEQALKPGDQVLVQVSKDPVGHKGARLTTQISLAGRFLVYVPSGTSTGISRKLPDTERKRLKEILREIVPADAGVIIRTASEGVSEPELARDVERLQATWRTIEKAAAGKDSSGPKALYEEPDLLVKVIRDLFNEDFSKLVIEGDRAWSTVEKYIGTVAPDLLTRVSRHENNGVDVFEAHRIDEQLSKALDRKVWLPSGGTLVIDRTEAMTVIDVNTGKFTGSGGSNLEETVTRNNLEAAEEIVRQMRLRDIGGMIVVDFIDMVLESNRDLVLRRLTEALGRDRTRHQVSEVTSLGLVQMTRKKLGTGLVEAFSTTCEHCQGRGILVHTYPVEASASSSNDDGGRKDSGSRRRRGRDKNAPAAAAPSTPEPATNGSAPAPAEEDIAVKRAHPVALAMASHHPDSDEVAASSDDTAVVEQEAAVAVPADDAEVVPAEAVEVAEAREASPRKRSGRGRSAKNRSSDKPADSAAVEQPEAVTAPTDTQEAAATSAVVEASVPAQAHAPAEPTAPAGSDAPTNGAPAPAQRPARRRRVARSTAAPAADSAGAVFVLPSAEQAAPVAIDYSDPEPPEVPVRRPRRRAVGRPAGAPD